MECYKVLVTGLGPFTDWNLLTEHFGRIGEIVHVDHDNSYQENVVLGNNRHIFDIPVVITFKNKLSADLAIAKFDNCLLNGKKISVKNLYHPSPPHPEMPHQNSLQRNIVSPHVLDYYDGQQGYNQDWFNIPLTPRQDLIPGMTRGPHHNANHQPKITHQSKAMHSRTFVNEKYGFDGNKPRVARRPDTRYKNRNDERKDAINHVQLHCSTGNFRNSYNKEVKEAENMKKQSNTDVQNVTYKKIMIPPHRMENKSANRSKYGEVARVNSGATRTNSGSLNQEAHSKKSKRKNKSKSSGNKSVNNTREPPIKQSETQPTINIATKLMNAIYLDDGHGRKEIPKAPDKKTGQKNPGNEGAVSKISNAVDSKDTAGSSKASDKSVKSLKNDIIPISVLDIMTDKEWSSESKSRLVESKASTEKEPGGIQGGKGPYKCGLGRSLNQPIQFPKRNASISNGSAKAGNRKSGNSANGGSTRGRGYGRGAGGGRNTVMA